MMWCKICFASPFICISKDFNIYVYDFRFLTVLGELREAGLILGSLDMEKQIFADTGS